MGYGDCRIGDSRVTCLRLEFRCGAVARHAGLLASMLRPCPDGMSGRPDWLEEEWP
jgi:hypothetical protein